MKFAKQNEHKIDLVFPAAVFFVFAASALAVLILSAHAYSSQVQSSNESYKRNTSLSYVGEKIRQNDASGGISVSKLEETPCLVLCSGTQEASYLTYIYEYEGMLKELFIRSDVDARLEDGRDVMEVSDFTMDEIGDGLFRFTSADADGTTSVLIASERSAP